MSKPTRYQMREALGRLLMPHRHTAMLSPIITAFALRPIIGDGLVATVLFNFAIVLLLIFALYAIQVDELIGAEAALRAERRGSRIIGWTLALAAVALHLTSSYSSSPSMAVPWELCAMLFFAFVVWNELRAILRQRQITGKSISMAISIYLLLVVTWSFLYDIIYQLQPTAFSLNGAACALVAPGHPIFPVLGYFSFITLTTVGYGDIAPVTCRHDTPLWLRALRDSSISRSWSRGW